MSPSYLTATPGNLTRSVYADTADLTVTPLIGSGNGSASYFVVRHSNYSSLASTSYKLHVPTSAGNLTVPQVGGKQLTLNGRDSKVHVVDYNVSGTNILYSTAEVFTWKDFAGHKVLVLYGGDGEYHEFAVSSASSFSVVEGQSSDITKKSAGDSVIIGWEVSSSRRIVQVDDLKIFLLSELKPVESNKHHLFWPRDEANKDDPGRNAAYDYWVPELPAKGTLPGFSTAETTASSIIVKAGYLVRTAYLQGSNLHLTADFNATTPIEVIGAPAEAESLFVNGKEVQHSVDKNGIWVSSIEFSAPTINLPSLKGLDWKSLDTLPEIQPGYDDSAWTVADHETTNNTARSLHTPTSLYSSDYGFHAGYLIYRGRFVSKGNETSLFIHTQGGLAFGSSVWLNKTLLGSYPGVDKYSDGNSTYQLPKLKEGEPYILTVLIDNTGLDEDGTVGSEEMKNPRGILGYELSGRNAKDISWKLTGNLGGEDYLDKARGPLNEGGLYAERQGFHQPEPPSASWKSSSPLQGLSAAGAAFYTSSFDLDIPAGWDVQLYVNGYQFGKYVNHIGPQTEYPVPEGILNYQGKNWIAVSLWAMEPGGAKLDSLDLIHRAPVKTALSGIKSVEQPKYAKRQGAY